jgi:subtilisin family serine protease/subtilisin-like proprotein convertase family protein
VICYLSLPARIVPVLLGILGSLILGVADPAPLLFRLPEPVSWLIDPPAVQPSSLHSADSWLTGRRSDVDNERVEFGSRVVVQTAPGINLKPLLLGDRAHLARALPERTWILQALDAQTAVLEAHRLAQLPGVQVSYPVMRQDLRLHGPYERMPNDSYFDQQWYLENRGSDGTPIGVDLNVRAAWPFSLGTGVAVAIVDDGVELSHPEFARRAHNQLHFNFGTSTTNGLPVSFADNHATAVAGFALAELNNQLGIGGVAPDAQIASWKIFQGSTFLPTDEQMMDMFQFHSNIVAVQNHSWGNASIRQTRPTFLERVGISNAVHSGRAGRGVVMVRSAGNGRQQSSNVNDDAYASDPQVIAVAAVRRDGRVADYSNPGAAILLAAPGGAPDGNLFTTDRQGTLGFNSGTFTNDFANYVSSAVIRGTSFAAPQVTGLVALLLSANPELTVRDVQLILALASRHFDLDDPDLRPNGAGLLFSHNTGFGVPDAGHALELALRWPNRPPPVEIIIPSTASVAIPDDGMRVRIDGHPTLPTELLSIPSTPGSGPHADDPTESLPLVDVGLANQPITIDLSGRAALIERGGNLFSEKLTFAANAGAAFAVVHNHIGGDSRLMMGGTEFVPIPAVLINQNHGELLRQQVQQYPDTRAQLRLESARYGFPVTRTLVCEHVSVRVRTTHTRRGDLRITLTSPMGTRSVLQHLNQDMSSGPNDWTYHSVQHFLESSAGNWLVEISDQQPGDTGAVTGVDLILRGVEITDSDRDGLDDAWELQWFNSLAFGPRHDPDRDGYNNAFEQVLGSNPLASDIGFRVDLSPWNDQWLRVSWPGVAGRSYDVLTGLQANQPLFHLTEVPGRFPVTEWFTLRSTLEHQFFRITVSEPDKSIHP